MTTTQQPYLMADWLKLLEKLQLNFAPVFPDLTFEVRSNELVLKNDECTARILLTFREEEGVPFFFPCVSADTSTLTCRTLDEFQTALQKLNRVCEALRLAFDYTVGVRVSLPPRANP